MEYIKNTTDIKRTASAVTLGKFDGIHRGHQLLIDRVVDRGNAGLCPTVFTFDVAPALVIEADSKTKTGDKIKTQIGSGPDSGCNKSTRGQLLTSAERVDVLKRHGIEAVIEYPFDDSLRRMPAEDFVRRILVDKLDTKYIAIGSDFCFGYERRGNADLLERMSSECGYELDLIDKKRIDGRIVSSTAIRGFVAEGRMEDANKFLGYDFFLSGTIVDGNHLGHTWGIPTININMSSDKLLPQNGVYFSKTTIDGRTYNSITNIGNKPTIGDSYSKGAETHIFDFDEDVYGKKAIVSIEHFHRKEMKFAGIEELIPELKKDIAAAKKYYGSGRADLQM